MTFRSLLYVALALGTAMGPARAGEPPQPPEAPYRVVTSNTPRGRIEGTVRLARAVEVQRLGVPAGCERERDLDGVERADALVSFDRSTLALKGCVVSLRRIAEGKDWPLRLQQPAPRFALTVYEGVLVPSVRWVRTGTRLAFSNELLHSNVNLIGRWRPPASDRGSDAPPDLAFHLLLAPQATLEPSDDTVLRRAGVYAVRCDCNCLTHLHAHVLAFDHPYVDGPTGRDGAYALDDVPPGTYEVVCWHGPMSWTASPHIRFGPPVESVQTVTVAAGERVRLDLTLEPR